MKLFLSLTILLAFVALTASQACEQKVNYMIANDCHCATTDSPLPVADTPQVNCASGVCPENAHPGIWVTPIINLIGDGVVCNNVQACRVEGTTVEIADWLMGQFNVLYQTNRAPMNLILSLAWFMGTPNSFAGMKLFLDRLDTMDDVFIVSNSKAVQRMIKPQAIRDFSSDTGHQFASCTARHCTLDKDDEIRYMVSCVVCPTFAIRNRTVRTADVCNTSVCPGNSCQCSYTYSPIDVEETPQLITLVYVDAITDAIYSSYLQPIIEGRTNPDGVQIGATFYVPHEYTDYERVNQLYNLGVEIAVHTVTRNSLVSYWKEVSVDTLVEEFYGQRQIISRFANIPIEDIIGAKVPHLEMLGNDLFEAYVESGIEYDNTWTARSTNRYFPYTLDYRSLQPCELGTCPDESFPGMWVLPLVDLVSQNNLECSSLQACSVSGTANEINDWLKEQFNRVYSDNKAPITLVLSSGWFATSTANLEGLQLFLDDLQSYDDVFLVSHKQVMDWMLNPVETSSFATDVYYKDERCTARTCQLLKDEEIRYMKSCVACPMRYPWLGNPLGS
ncbi:chitin deacetylase-like 9 isoform a [Holotrichia oblita]|uniref:Chitin deacetylase-like 9 isoform a n=1 Tax=Holotrichia oblita TaxID=644536 RepID=A0ACB9TGR7_HOLOL|nr:chitin deacetylase-like 9 isoform a [Holotrichia oblita]